MLNISWRLGPIHSARMSMAKRALKRRAAIMVALFAIPAAFVLWKYLTLRTYQAFIHEHYAAEIKQLEGAMLQWPENQFQDEDTHQRVEALREALRQTFSTGDFYCASWSYDSHHGATCTGFPEGGYTTYGWVSTTGNMRQSLCYGRSSGGVPLLVYQRWLPNSPVMRHIKIVLYRDKVNKSMKAEKAN